MNDNRSAIHVSEVGPCDGLQSIRRTMAIDVKRRWIGALHAAGPREIDGPQLGDRLVARPAQVGQRVFLGHRDRRGQGVPHDLAHVGHLRQQRGRHERADLEGEPLYATVAEAGLPKGFRYAREVT